jgi:hypothetical protein
MPPLPPPPTHPPTPSSLGLVFFILLTGLDEDVALKKAMEDTIPWTECVKVFFILFCVDFLLFCFNFLLCVNAEEAQQSRHIVPLQTSKRCRDDHKGKTRVGIMVRVRFRIRVS